MVFGLLICTLCLSQENREMTDYHKTNDRERMIELVSQIEKCNEFLKMKKHKDRRILPAFEKANLVKVQLQKAMLIAELKICVRNMTNFPKSVKKIYF